jgi:Na+-driven multidrug efflux pump
MQGTGDTRGPLYISLISQFALPIGFLTFMQTRGVLEPHHIWLAIVMGHFLRAALSVWRFEQGKWRKIELGLAKR